MAPRTEDPKNREMPPSFEDALRPNYLGSPTVVEGLLEGFLKDMLRWIRERSLGVLSSEKMQEEAHAAGKRFSKIFAGEDPGYLPVRGWNSRIGGLNACLKVDLGPYWIKNHDEYDNDPFRAMHGWLLWALFTALKLDDPDLTAMKMGSNIRTVVGILTGTVKRQWA